MREALTRIYDPADPLYGHYLTPAAFAARYSPLPSEYEAAAAELANLGLEVTKKHPTQLDLPGAASTTLRNVPDVSFNADPDTGYASYYHGTWQIYGGTSCSPPLWAAFAARVNQRRLANGESLLGFANPALYALAQSSSYGNDFHDIDDGSNNLFYPATVGYDNATGWGSPNGANLLADLAPPPPAASPPANLTAVSGNHKITLRWDSSPGATGYRVYQGKSPGQEILVTATPLKASQYQGKALRNGEVYYYQVTALNHGSESDFSAEISATPSA